MLLTAGNIDVRKLLGGDAAGVPITQMVVGTSNAAVTGNETALTNPVIKTITTIDYTTAQVVLFITTLLASDPAMTIREMGLINANGVLVYRTVVPDKAKVAGLTYNLNYRILVK